MSAPSPRIRRNAPDSVRQALLLCTACLIAQRGLAALTVQDVADAAGVSKGALFHHFANKQALIDAALAALTDDFEVPVRFLLEQDEIAYGRFSRAYVRACFDHLLQQEQANDIGLSLAHLLEPALLAHWRGWMRRLLAEFPADPPRRATHVCTPHAAWPMATGPRLTGNRSATRSNAMPWPWRRKH